MTIFTVQPDHAKATTGTLTWETPQGRMNVKVAIGRSGTTPSTIEGDGATPLGVFPIRRVYYRPDRELAPRTELEVRATKPDDGWCDTPNDPFYNRPVTLPHATSCETLWRDDAVYNLIVVIGQNDAPVIPSKGSAIFVHVAREAYAPTEGCIGMKVEDLRTVIATAKPGDAFQVLEA